MPPHSPVPILDPPPPTSADERLVVAVERAGATLEAMQERLQGLSAAVSCLHVAAQHLLHLGTLSYRAWHGHLPETVCHRCDQKAAQHAPRTRQEVS